MRIEELSNTNAMPTRDSVSDSELFLVPAGSVVGVALTTTGPRPIGANSVVFELAVGDSVSYVIKAIQPVAAPSPVLTRSGADYGRVDQSLGLNVMIYITAVVGTPSFMWV